MNLTAEIERLAALHAAGSLTDDEFVKAKAALLSGRGGGQDPSVVRTLLQEQRRATAVDELDRAWEQEKDGYMMTRRTGKVVDRDGAVVYRWRPTRGVSLLIGYLITVVGLSWTVRALSMRSAFAPFPGSSSVQSPVYIDPGTDADPFRGGTPAGFVTIDPKFLQVGRTSDRSFDVLPWFGIAFVVYGLWFGFQGYTRAEGYEAGLARYQRRRAALLSGRDDPEPAEADESGWEGGGDEGDGGGDAGT